MLSDEERRTLVEGGWLQDTKRSIIEEESAAVLSMAAIKTLIDVEKLAIYGQRRSVGMLKSTCREGETMEQVKDRMWRVIKLVSGLKHQLPSTRMGREGKTLWISCVKSKNARARSAHVSLIWRVIELTTGAAHNNGENAIPCNALVTAYDDCTSRTVT